MAALSISSLLEYFSDDQKSIKRGENHFKSDHIESFQYQEGIVCGMVHASMKDKRYKTMVYTKDKKILSSNCDCPRGEYKCSHTAALIIYAIHNLSITDVECSWKKAKTFGSDIKPVDELYPPTKNYNSLQRPSTTEDKDWLYSKLKQYGKFTGLAWIISPEPPPKPDQILPTLSVQSVLSSQEFMDSSDQMSYFMRKLQISESDIATVESLTKDQCRDTNWHDLRKGRLTASNFGSVLNAKRVTPALVKRVVGDFNLSGVQAVHWGIINEQEGIQSFRRNTGLDVQQSGLWLHPSGILGASPDGLVGDNAIIEVKCPFTHREKTILEVINIDKNFYLIRNDDDQLELKEQHAYWHQVQGQLHIANRKICYFVVWTLKDTYVVKIKRDDAWSLNINRLIQFYLKSMLPVLMEKRE